MKKLILEEVDKYLFSNIINSLQVIYLNAIELNNDNPFTYAFFSPNLIIGEGNNSFAVHPSLATIEYLKPFVEEYTPLIERRERIQYYLLQFMNQSDQDADVIHLLPPLTLAHIKELSSYVREQHTVNLTTPNLVKLFKKKPEYEIIIQQEVFMTMGI